MFEIEHLSMYFFRFVVLISLIILQLVHNLLTENNIKKTNTNKSSSVELMLKNSGGCK